MIDQSPSGEMAWPLVIATQRHRYLLPGSILDSVDVLLVGSTNSLADGGQ